MNKSEGLKDIEDYKNVFNLVLEKMKKFLDLKILKRIFKIIENEILNLFSTLESLENKMRIRISKNLTSFYG